MYRKTFRIYLAIGVSLVFAIALPCIATDATDSPGSSQGDWELIGRDDDVTVYRRDVPDSPIVAFRGEGVIDANIEKVLSITFDTDRAPEWVSNIKELKTIRRINRLEWLVYSHILSPVPLVDDRDFVSICKIEDLVIRGSEKGMRLEYHEVSDHEVPLKNDVVRGDLTGTVYTYRSLDQGRKTFVSFEIRSNPRGSIPKWLVNFFQRLWPRRTIQALREQAVKPDIEAHPLVVELFKLSLDGTAEL